MEGPTDPSEWDPEDVQATVNSLNQSKRALERPAWPVSRKLAVGVFFLVDADVVYGAFKDGDIRKAAAMTGLGIVAATIFFVLEPGIYRTALDGVKERLGILKESARAVALYRALNPDKRQEQIDDTWHDEIKPGSN